MSIECHKLVLKNVMKIVVFEFREITFNLLFDVVQESSLLTNRDL